MTLLLSACICGVSGVAQQSFQFSQYMENLYLINPATAGINKEPDFGIGYRNQWSGLREAPRTFYATGQIMFGNHQESKQSRSLRISSPSDYKQFHPGRKAKHAMGVFLLSDEFGAFRKNNVSLTYAFHIPLSAKYTLSLGTSGGLSNVTFDQSKAQVEQIGDNTYGNFIATGGSMSTNVFDVNLGAWFYAKQWFAGYSVYQLMGNAITFGDNSTDAKLELFLNAMAGYHWQVDDSWLVSPSVLVKLMPPAPVVVDVSVKVDYQDRVWGGLSYRHPGSAIVLFGLHVNDMLRIGYAFDYSLSTQLRQLGTSSHELMIGIRPLDKERRKTVKF